MLPSAAELSYFLEVTNTLNISLAAKNLRITQPTLSRSIQRLEENLGTELLIRHKKGVTLTPAGKKLLIHTKKLLDNWNTAKHEALTSHTQVTGQIRIGCHATVGLFIHPLIAELLADYPELNIELKHAPSACITQQVINTQIDVGIVANPIQYPDLIIHPLRESETTLWRSNTKSHLQNIDGKDAVLFCNPEITHTEKLIKECRAKGIIFKRIVKTNSLEVTANMAANGCGVALLPSCITQTLFGGRLQRIPNMPAISDTLHVIYRHEYRDINNVKTVVKRLKLAKDNCHKLYPANKL